MLLHSHPDDWRKWEKLKLKSCSIITDYPRTFRSNSLSQWILRIPNSWENFWYQKSLLSMVYRIPPLKSLLVMQYAIHVMNHPENKNNRDMLKLTQKGKVVRWAWKQWWHDEQGKWIACDICRDGFVSPPHTMNNRFTPVCKSQRLSHLSSLFFISPLLIPRPITCYVFSK